MANQTAPVTVTIEGARLIYKNFSGKKDKFNAEGERNFGVILPTDLAVQMEADSWNVKWMDPREEGDEAVAWIPVKVRYENRPPRVVMVTSTTDTLLNEDTVGAMDIADFTNVDVIIRAYDWEVNGKVGRAAYLQTMFATLYEDELMLKYSARRIANMAEPTSFVSDDD